MDLGGSLTFVFDLVGSGLVGVGLREIDFSSFVEVEVEATASDELWRTRLFSLSLFLFLSFSFLPLASSRSANSGSTLFPDFFPFLTQDSIQFLLLLSQVSEIFEEGTLKDE